ncbi:MAG: hypothetical protein KDK99_17115 [Verrucomicrobiales bacterium]|nr:hypothetical protein [Verrucomicrobiales bacterium]
MSAITFGFQALLVSAVGWLVLRLLVSDARHRAWGSLLVLATITCLPLIPTLSRETDSDQVHEKNAMASFPKWTVTMDGPAQSNTGSTDVALDVEAHRWTWPHWSQWVLGLWGAGIVGMGLVHAVRSVQVATAKWKPHSRGVWVGNVASPCVSGVLKPVIVVPENRDWTEDQWRWTLAHETEHLRGRDTQVVWLLGWLRAALWWNPFVHALIGMWEQAREEICDHAASSREEAQAYGEFLLDIASAGRLPGMAMAASRPARRLRARLTSLLDGREVRRGPQGWFLVSVMALLGCAAVLVSCVSFEAEAPKAEDEVLLTRIFRVDPYFLNVSASGAQTSSTRTAEEVLREMYVDFPPGASAVFNRVTSQLIVRNTERRLEQIEGVLETLAARQEFDSKQVYISTKWVEYPDEPDWIADTFRETFSLSAEGMDSKQLLPDLEELTDPQFQVVIRALSQRKGVDLLAAPSVTCKWGQKATVELSPLPPKTGAEINWTGVSAEFTPLFHDGKLRLGLQADLSVPAKHGSRANSHASAISSTRARHLTRRESVEMEDGHTLVVHMGQSVSGRRVMLFVKVMLISPTGQPADVERLKRLQH